MSKNFSELTEREILALAFRSRSTGSGRGTWTGRSRRRPYRLSSAERWYF